MAVVCHEAVSLMLFSAAGLRTCSHTGQIPNWEIQTPKRFLSLPNIRLCYDTVAAASRSISLHGDVCVCVCVRVDVAGRHSASLHCRSVTLWMASAVVQIVWPRAKTRDGRIVKIAFLLAFLRFSSSRCSVRISVRAARTRLFRFSLWCLAVIFYTWKI